MVKERLLILVKKIALVLSIGLGYAFFVQKTGISVPCMFYKVTGFYCPGCGVTRMCLSLMKGDLIRAFHYNMGIMICLPILVWIGFQEMISYVKEGKRKKKRRNEILLWLMLGGLLLFGVLRNLPSFSWLAPIGNT